MKKVEYKEVEATKDISPELAAIDVLQAIDSDIFEDALEITEDEIDENYVDEWLDNYIDVSDEDRKIIYDIVIPAAKEKYKKYKEELKKEEADEFKDREHILNVLESALRNPYSYTKEFYVLSTEEILNLILENGTKSGT